MAKTPTNLTLHDRIRELAAKLQAHLGYESLSTLVEELIRSEYVRQCGPIQMKESPPEENWNEQYANSGMSAEAIGRLVINGTIKVTSGKPNSASPAAPAKAAAADVALSGVTKSGISYRQARTTSAKGARPPHPKPERSSHPTSETKL